MNEFTFMTAHTISAVRSDPNDLFCWRADTVVGPLTKGDGYTPLDALE